MARLNIDRQQKLEPERVQYAKEKITALGYTVSFQSDTEIRFEYKGSLIHFFPYSGWHTGKTIQDGRGLNKLLKQLK